ncbi:MAG: hypothetical protein ACRC3J_05315 [Culicoidibacterales bacterium]
MNFNDYKAHEIKKGSVVVTADGWTIKRDKYTKTWTAMRGGRFVTLPSFAALKRTVNIIMGNI